MSRRLKRAVLTARRPAAAARPGRRRPSDRRSSSARCAGRSRLRRRADTPGANRSRATATRRQHVARTPAVRRSSAAPSRDRRAGADPCSWPGPRGPLPRISSHSSGGLALASSLSRSLPRHRAGLRRPGLAEQSKRIERRQQRSCLPGSPRRADRQLSAGAAPALPSGTHHEPRSSRIPAS